jgi:membrane protease YdiL (CAAX protease family)
MFRVNCAGMKITARRRFALGLTVLGVIWALVNKSIGEGPILLNLGGGHGLTAADLLSVAAFAAALCLSLPNRLRRAPKS